MPYTVYPNNLNRLIDKYLGYLGQIFFIYFANIKKNTWVLKIEEEY